MPRDSAPSKWDYPPHTKAKHDLLGYYLDGWFPIMASWQGRLLFLDGFAGRGRYNDGSEGSPLVALRKLVEHAHFPSMRHREFVFFLVEADEDNAKSLTQEIDRFKAEHAPWPETVKVNVINQKFDVTATEILEQLQEQKANLAPTFAFIDPFGYSGMPMDLIADLMAYPQTEVFVNFMVNYVNRFITRDGQENAMRKLFGMDIRRVLAEYDPCTDRAEHLRAVYERQLKEQVGFDHVQSFAMINQTGNVGYYLLHGTRHKKGVQLMKSAMWRVDPGGGFVFSDRLANEDVLFVPDPDLKPLRHELLTHYEGQHGISAEEIQWHTLLHTPYRETHVRPVLRALEQDGVIQVDRPSGKKQFAPGVTVSFPTNAD